MIEQRLINQRWRSRVTVRHYFWFSVLDDQYKELGVMFLIKVIHGLADMGKSQIALHM